MRIRIWVVGGALACWLACGWGVAQDFSSRAPSSEKAATEMVEPGTEPAKTLSLLELLLKGGPLMFPLGLCSIVIVAFAFERGMALRRSRVLPANTLVLIQMALRSSGEWLDVDTLRKDLAQRADPLSRVAIAGLRKAGRTIQEIEKAIEDAGAKEAGALRRNCRVLSMVASIAPLLGLTGTVTGMIKSFMTVAARAEALGRTELLAGGIYEALVTTAVGLAIAIPALVFYYFYMEKVESFVTELDSIAEELVAKIPTRG